MLGEKNQQKLQRCPAKPSTHTYQCEKTSTLPLDSGKFRLLCSGSCVSRIERISLIINHTTQTIW